MFCYATPATLRLALEQRSEKVRKPKHATLFRRGEKAAGLFVVLSGRVSLDFGVETALSRAYGPGALLGLPATLTNRNYSMTATVIEDSELGFCSSQTLHSLLQEHPELCQQVLGILGERVAENLQVAKALLSKGRAPQQRSGVV